MKKMKHNQNRLPINEKEFQQFHYFYPVYYYNLFIIKIQVNLLNYQKYLYVEEMLMFHFKLKHRYFIFSNHNKEEIQILIHIIQHLNYNNLELSYDLFLITFQGTYILENHKRNK